MVKQLWINLPVKDVNQSKTFFAQLGFRFNPHYPENNSSASMLIGEKDVVVMLFEESLFKNFTGKDIAVTGSAAQVLLSIDAQSKEEVDEMARKVLEAGGQTNHQPSEMQGGMYGCVFTDMDGHSWNVLYMDMSKMQKG